MAHSHELLILTPWLSLQMTTMFLLNPVGSDFFSLRIVDLTIFFFIKAKARLSDLGIKALSSGNEKIKL